MVTDRISRVTWLLAHVACSLPLAFQTLHARALARPPVSSSVLSTLEKSRWWLGYSSEPLTVTDRIFRLTLRLVHRSQMSGDTGSVSAPRAPSSPTQFPTPFRGPIRNPTKGPSSCVRMRPPRKFRHTPLTRS
eukprot:7195556-Pyramimonas_sp.AAC.1